MTRLKLMGGFRPVLVVFILFLAMAAVPVQARQYAAMVMDARTGEVLHSRNADTRLHPASLTKMMTLYVVFEAVENGEITLDTKVTISRNAAAEPASKLYLKSGQKIALRYLIRGAAVKSANDAATALAEAISGSEAAFAARMTRTAKALGMNKTTFRNAHGLTQSGHLSTARDMSILGRHLFYDYPEYYNLFSRKSTDAGVRTVYNTNRKLLSAYRGADGIKTGYTNAAGSNLVASAERGNVRIIATMFGGSSSAARNKRVAELLDMGFQRAPTRVAVNKPRKPNYATASGRLVVAHSPVPKARPAHIVALAAAAEQTEVARVAVAETPVTPPEATPAPVETAALAEVDRPESDPADVVTMRKDLEDVLAALPPAPAPVVEALPREAQPVVIRPKPRPARVTYSTAQTAQVAETPAAEPVIVSAQVPISGGWGVRVGRYPTRWQAERVLLQTALQQYDLLGDARREVVSRPRGFEVEFVGMSESEAQLTCRRLSAVDADCAPFQS